MVDDRSIDDFVAKFKQEMKNRLQSKQVPDSPRARSPSATVGGFGGMQKFRSRTPIDSPKQLSQLPIPLNPRQYDRQAQRTQVQDTIGHEAPGHFELQA